MSDGKNDHETVCALICMIHECTYRMSVAIRKSKTADDDKVGEILKESGGEAADISAAVTSDLEKILHESFHIEEHSYDEAIFKPLWDKYRADQHPG